MRSILLEFATKGIGIDAVVVPVAKSHHDGEILATQTDTTEHLTGVLPVRRQQAISLKLDGKDETLAVLDLPNVHTLDADGLSTQLVGYLFSNSLTAVVNYNN